MAQNDNEPDNSPAEVRRQLLAGILASDLAVEIAAEFDGSLSNARDVTTATARVLGRFHSALSSPNEGPVLLVALAALQLREGQLQTFVRDAAIDLIETGEALAAYRPADFSQRKSVAGMLEQFRQWLAMTTTVQD